MGDVDTAPDVASRGREADAPRNSSVARFGADRPLKLDAGVELSPFQIAYKTYGTLNAERSNAVLICHALTGDQHVASPTPVTGKSGWLETMVGPGRPIDTERYFVICPNVLGACMGTTGPASTNPKTGQPWGLEFPMTTVRDMVRAQAMLLDHLGIGSLFSVAGGSMGGKLSGARVFGSAARLCDAPFRAEHRVPRGRPPSRDGRSGVARRPLFRHRHQSPARIGGGPHGRAHHLSVG